MLSTNQPTRISGLYINDIGAIAVYDFTVDYYVDADDYNDKPMWQKLLADLQHNILILRGLSKYETFTDRNLKTEKFDIKYTNSRLSKWELDTPCFGSARECLEMNIKTFASVIMSNAKINYRNVYVKVVDNNQYLNPLDDNIFLKMIVVDDSGISYRSYKLYYDYTQDRNPSCTTCISGMNAFKINIAGFSNTPINISGNLHTVDGFVVTDVNIETEERIVNMLKATLAPTIAMAKITNIRLEKA